MRGQDVAELLAEDRDLRCRLVEYAAARFRIDRTTAGDLLQETALDLIRFDGYVRRPEGFAFAVFHTRCCRLVTRQAERRRTLEQTPLPVSRTPRDEASERDLAVALRQGLRMISPGCRKLLTAYYLEGRSLKETAAVRSVSPTGVWTLINRCLRRLRGVFERR